MAYTKKTWATGDTITDDLLNNIENGISTIDSSLTSLASNKSTATNGQVLTANGNGTATFKDSSGTDSTSINDSTPSTTTTYSGTKIENIKNNIGSQMNDVVINIKSFGAKGDGVTDDTASIQSALDYSDSNRVYIYFPNGTYIVKNTLLLGYNVLLKGAVRGLETNGQHDSNSICQILFTPNDTTIPLFKGKSGITGGQIIMECLFFSTTTIYYTNTRRNTFIDGYNCNSHSYFYALQIINFNYIFTNLKFQYASRMGYCSIRNIGKAIFYNCEMVDSCFYNNYFNGTGDGTHISSFMLGCAKLYSTQFINNWFEFFKYIFDCSSTQGIDFTANHIDFTYRIFNALGICCSLTANIINDSSRNTMVSMGTSWTDPDCLADNDWVLIKVVGHSGISIIGNVSSAVDRLIEIISSVKDMHTYGNVFYTDNATTPFNPDDKLIRVSVGTTGWLGSAHLSNVKLEEINDLSYTTAPTTGLVPGRKVFINNKSVYLDSKYIWRYTDDGTAYGYKSKNLIPKTTDSSWGFDGVNWVPSSDGFKVTASGYVTNAWKDYSVLVVASAGQKYRFNTNTPYYASDGTSRNYLELHFLNASGVDIGGTISIDSRTGAYYFTTPANTANIKVCLNINYSPGVIFTFDTLTMTLYSESDYADIKTRSDGSQILTYLDNTNTTVVQPFI
jgi:hypothetical protein